MLPAVPTSGCGKHGTLYEAASWHDIGALLLGPASTEPPRNAASSSSSRQNGGGHRSSHVQQHGVRGQRGGMRVGVAAARLHSA